VERRVEGEVLAHGEVGVEHALVRDEADQRPQARPGSAAVDAGDTDGPHGGRRQPRDHPQQGALAGPVPAHQRDRGAGGDREVDAHERRHRAEGARHPGELDVGVLSGGGHASSHSASNLEAQRARTVSATKTTVVPEPTLRDRLRAVGQRVRRSAVEPHGHGRDAVGDLEAELAGDGVLVDAAVGHVAREPEIAGRHVRERLARGEVVDHRPLEGVHGQPTEGDHDDDPQHEHRQPVRAPLEREILVGSEDPAVVAGVLRELLRGGPVHRRLHGSERSEMERRQPPPRPTTRLGDGGAPPRGPSSLTPLRSLCNRAVQVLSGPLAPRVPLRWRRARAYRDAFPAPRR
jgi:hypothetical protein